MNDEMAGRHIRQLYKAEAIPRMLYAADISLVPQQKRRKHQVPKRTQVLQRLKSIWGNDYDRHPRHTCSTPSTRFGDRATATPSGRQTNHTTCNLPHIQFLHSLCQLQETLVGLDTFRRCMTTSLNDSLGKTTQLSSCLELTLLHST